MRPMLAAKARDLADLRFPLCVTPKLDGIRCLVADIPRTRAWKPLRNKHTSDLLATLPRGLDGELMCDGGFSEVQSAFMSSDGEPVFTYLVFDTFAHPGTYWERAHWLANEPLPPWVTVLIPEVVYDLSQFLAYEELQLRAGHEGVVGRSALGPYKEGRSSLSEHYMVKWKRVCTREARVVSVEEGKTNLNPIVRNVFGAAKRPGGSKLKVPRGTLGNFVCEDLLTGARFDVGNGKGMDDALRAAVWSDPGAYIGRIIRYTYQEFGTGGRPRFPQFAGFRHEDDM